MKKALFIGISAALILLALSACGDTASAPKQEETEPVETVTQEPTAEPVEDIAPVELPAVTSDELLPLFEEAYSLYKEDETGAGYAMELMSIEGGAMALGKQLPSDYEEQYKVWRDAQQTPSTSAPFTEVDETVYATGTVNIRAGYSADSDKLGSLSTGSSVTRTGIGTEEADGWSRVSLSDGTVAYISSQYLSTTKPSTPSGGSKPSGNSQGSTQGSGGSSQSNPEPGVSKTMPSNVTKPSDEEFHTGIEDPYDTIYKPIF